MFNIENLTLVEVKAICEKHHKENRDCESCLLCKFCGHDMITRDPSSWRLSDDDYKKEIEEV